MKTDIIYEQPECRITEIEALSVLCQSGAIGQFYLSFAVFCTNNS